MLVQVRRTFLKRGNTTRLSRENFFFQFPIAPAFGWTVYRSQGLTIKNSTIFIDLDGCDIKQTYVALSRACKIDQIKILPPK